MYKNNKIVFFAIKGRGDFLVLINFLKNHEIIKYKSNIEIYVLKEFSHIANIYLNNHYKIHLIQNKLNYLHSFNSIRHYKKIISTLYCLRILQKKIKNQGLLIINDIVFDYSFFPQSIKTFLKAFFFFKFDNKIVTNNIYRGYENFFGITNSPILENKKIKNVAIFYDSQSVSRKFPTQLINSIQKKLIKFNVRFTFYSFSNKKNNHLKNNYSFFYDDYDLKNIISSSDLIISNDSYPLHVAFFLNKQCLILSNAWTCFIPECYLNNYFFRFNETNLFLKKLSKVINDSHLV